MANFIYNKIICSKQFLEKYLIDYYPISQENRQDPPYISFNRLVGVTDLNEYREKFGEYIYYGCGFSYDAIGADLMEVKFTTIREYPIVAIRKALQVDHSIQWFAMQDNGIYVSHYFWSDGIHESICCLPDDFYDYCDQRYEFEESLSDCDNIVWYYLEDYALSWQPWSDSLDLPRFYDEGWK